jgi:hypothetical protein
MIATLLGIDKFCGASKEKEAYGGQSTSDINRFWRQDKTYPAAILGPASNSQRRSLRLYSAFPP